MRLNVTLQTADLVLQPAARPLESIVERELNVGMALVEAWSASNIDLFSTRKRQPDIDLVEASVEVAPARCLEHDPAGGYAREAILKRCNPRDNGSAQCFAGLHALKVDLNPALHDYAL